MARLSPSQQREIIRNASRAARQRGAGGLFRRLGAKYGPLGELVGMLGDILAGGRRPTRRNIEDAVEILTEHGFEVSPSPPEPPPIQQPPVIAPPPVRRTAGHPLPSARATPRPSQPAADPWPGEHEVRQLPTRIRGMYEDIPSDIPDFSPWILTPESSNVYAFAYDYGQQILYVQFRAPGKPQSYKESISICSGKAYKVGVRANAPGPIYSYGGAGRPVPPGLFDEFVRARSKGKAVWDKLRVCGSQWQHKYPYTLTDVPAEQSVPRKATRRGLRVRTVPTVGSGRRTGRRSTLPESIGRV